MFRASLTAADDTSLPGGDIPRFISRSVRGCLQCAYLNRQCRRFPYSSAFTLCFNCCFSSSSLRAFSVLGALRGCVCARPLAGMRRLPWIYAYRRKVRGELAVSIARTQAAFAAEALKVEAQFVHTTGCGPAGLGAHWQGRQ